jgi:hypothetical protein
MTAWHSLAVKSLLFCDIFTSDLQETLNNQTTTMKFRSDVYKTINFDEIKVLLVPEKGERRKAEDLPAPLLSRTRDKHVIW